MKITRRQLRQLINETIYVSPEGDAYNTDAPDPTSQEDMDYHNNTAKMQFLNSQGGHAGAKLKTFIPDVDDVRDASDSDIADLNQGVALADMVGDQGYFKGLSFTDDEINLRDFASEEIRSGTEASKARPKHILPKTSYSEQFSQLERSMEKRAQNYLQDNPVASYWDVIAVIEDTPGYFNLMTRIGTKEGDFSNSMNVLNNLPEKVANKLGVFY